MKNDEMSKTVSNKVANIIEALKATEITIAITGMDDDEIEMMASEMQSIAPISYEARLAAATAQAFDRGDIPNETEAEYVERLMSYGGQDVWDKIITNIRTTQHLKQMEERDKAFKKIIPNPTVKNMYDLMAGKYDGLLEEQGA